MSAGSDASPGVDCSGLADELFSTQALLLGLKAYLTQLVEEGVLDTNAGCLLRRQVRVIEARVEDVATQLFNAPDLPASTATGVES